MNSFKVSELQSGEAIHGFLLVDNISVKSKKSGEKFLAFSLKDKSGKIPANFWTPDRNDLEIYHSGDIIYVEGDITQYAGANQMVISKIRPLQPFDNVDPKEFVKTSPIPGEKMYEDMVAIINRHVENQDMKKLTLAIYEENRERLISSPAAISFHHAELGGLLRHSYTMMRSAFAIASVYTFLNKDLLLCGAALHDVGKLDENQVNEFGLFYAHTIDGDLVGHIIRGAMIIEQKGKEMGIDPEVIKLLSHMILSHHGKPEFGSPVAPRIPEAEILHAVDDIDAKLYEMEDALAKTNEGELSERCNAFDGIRLYRSKLTDVDESFK